MSLGKQIIMESLCSMVFCSPDIDKKCLWELYSIFNSLIVIHFLFSYLSFAVLEKNMVTDDSRKMTLGVMKMAHDCAGKAAHNANKFKMVSHSFHMRWSRMFRIVKPIVVDEVTFFTLAKSSCFR